MNDLPIQERPKTVAFAWTEGEHYLEEMNVEDYVAEPTKDRTTFELVQASIGWQVTDKQWQMVTRELVADALVVVLFKGAPVAIACGLSRPSDWTELAWVAVAPEHRGKGIGKMVCAAVVQCLLEAGRPKIYGSTQDERLSAIKIYLDLGFVPLYRAEKVRRWQSICAKLDLPFLPQAWGWPGNEGRLL